MATWNAPGSIDTSQYPGFGEAAFLNHAVAGVVLSSSYWVSRIPSASGVNAG